MELRSASLRAAAALVLGLGVPASAQGSRDLVVPAGTLAFYDTAQGPLHVGRLVIEADAELRVTGERPFVVVARRSIELHGWLDLSGFSAKDYAILNPPETLPGGPGGPAGGAGGAGSPDPDAPSLAGEPGEWTPGGGGGGGESGIAPGPIVTGWAGFGGGGALATNQPVSSDPADPANLGLVATSGANGSPDLIGALTGGAPALGGAAGRPAFVDDDPENDFFGRKLVPGRGVVHGELRLPLPGSGGGGGGDALFASPFEHPGNGGGGGGGLGVLVTRRLVLGPGAAIRSHGGRGGAPPAGPLFDDPFGGGGGGGSGGTLVLAAEVLDLSQADARSLTALGGAGAGSVSGARGGNGGPGVIQLHVPPGPGHLLLPPGRTLEGLSAPSAHVLLPVGHGGR